MSRSEFSFTSRWRPILQIGAGDTHTPTGAAVWGPVIGQSPWGNAASTWSGSEPIWGEYSCETFSAEIQSGRDYSVDRFPPAVATVEASNLTRWATQTTPNVSDIRPGRQLRIAVEDVSTGEVVPLFRGWIDSVSPTYDPGRTGDTVTFQCIDALGELGTYRTLALSSPAGAGETGDARFRRILNRAGWPAARTGVVDVSHVTMLGTTLERGFVDELGLLAESEGGAVLATEDAKLVFRNRDWQTWPASLPLTAEIGNVNPGAVCPTGMEITRRRDDDSTVTRVLIGNPNTAVPLQFDDTTAQAKYGFLVWDRTDLLCSNVNQLALLGRRVLATRKGGDGRLRSVAFAASTDPSSVVPLALGARLWENPPNRYRVAVADPGGSRIVDDVFMLQGIRHRITRDEWEFEFVLERTAPYTREVARWGTAYWGEDVWGTVALAAKREELESV